MWHFHLTSTFITQKSRLQETGMNCTPGCRTGQTLHTKGWKVMYPSPSQTAPSCPHQQA